MNYMGTSEILIKPASVHGCVNPAVKAVREFIFIYADNTFLRSVGNKVTFPLIKFVIVADASNIQSPVHHHILVRMLLASAVLWLR